MSDKDPGKPAKEISQTLKIVLFIVFLVIGIAIAVLTQHKPGP